MTPKRTLRAPFQEMTRSASSPSKLITALKFFMGLMMGFLMGSLLGGAYLIYKTWNVLPSVGHLANYDPVLPLRIYDRDGIQLAEYGEERRDFVPLERIPLQVRQALLAIEDAGYYEHGPIDFSGIARALISNFKAGEHAQGGSTITMQVARLFFLSREKTYLRKIAEVLLAYKLESVYSKDKILELYMNQVYLGQRSYGYAAAASVYFDKALEQLSLAEAAMLAGLPKAPSAYNPIANRERAVIRQRHILKRMLHLNYINDMEFQEALDEELVLRSQHNTITAATAYAVEQARQAVVARYGEEAYSLGLDVTLTIALEDQIAATLALRQGLLEVQERQGYSGPEGHVETLPDLDRPSEIRAALRKFQDGENLYAAIVLEASEKTGIHAVLRNGIRVQIPQKSLGKSALAALSPTAPARRRIGPSAVIRVMYEGDKGWRLKQLPRMEGALASLDVESGEILALAGGFDFDLNKFDHAVQGARQPGSTFKPFVFSAALEKGYFPGTLIEDLPREVIPKGRGRKAWRPRNYGNHYEGFISARRGLARSKNIVAVNMMEAAGAEYVQQFATRFGFVPELNPPSLTLALGSGSVTPLQLTQAYAVFANGGRLVQPRLISRVRERVGKIIYPSSPSPEPVPVISARNAYVMDSMLRDVVQHGTGRRAVLLKRKDLAGKTGTSNAAKDVWFAGYSSGVASVVWVGHSQPRSLGAVTGGSLALPIWMDYMKVVIEQRKEAAREAPADLARLHDDYIYKEYLAGHCIEDSKPFIQSPVACTEAPGLEIHSAQESSNSGAGAPLTAGSSLGS